MTSLFNSTHAALTYAFNYAGQQSPKTPLMSLIKNPGDGQLGTGKGLMGLDGAAQAGMILAEVCRLSDEQHNVIVARYGRVMHECKCCGQDAPSDEWRAAIDALSHCDELEGVHKKVRLIIVERALCGGKLESDKLAREYGHCKTVLYKQLNLVRERFRKIERLAINELDNVFFEKKLLTA